MRWAAPIWLWALVLVPFLGVLLYMAIQQQRKTTEAFASSTLWSKLAPEMDWSRWIWRGALWLSAVTFVILALARPQWGKIEETVPMVGLDLVVALDVSNSMLVEDVVPNRLQKAKHFLRSLLDHLNGDRVGVVAFASSTYLASPLTTDLEYVREILQITTPKSILNQGSDLGMGIETAVTALQRAAESSGKDSDVSAGDAKTDGLSPERVVLIISDGEDLEGQAVKAAESAKQAGVRVYALGVGTEQGGPIPTRDDHGQLHGYKRNAKGQSVVSTFLSKDLEAIASAGGGRFWTLSQYENELPELLFDLGRLQRTKHADRKLVLYQERFQWPLGIAVALLITEMLIPLRRRRTHKIAAVVVAMIGIVLLPLSMLAPSAWAADDEGATAPATAGETPDATSVQPEVNPLPVTRAPLRTYLGNRDALQDLGQGKIPDARRKLGQAQASDPDRSELFYNQGILDLKEERWEQAAENFERATELAKKSGQSALAGSARLNQGFAYEGAKNPRAAIQSYVDGIREARNAGDAELETDLRRKIQVSDRQQQKQQKDSESKDSKDPKDSESKDGSDGKPVDEKKAPEKSPKESPKESPDKPDPSKEGDQGQRPRDQFKGQKMNREDVERVMSELSNREKELKSKIQRQRGKSRPNERDW